MESKLPGKCPRSFLDRAQLIVDLWIVLVVGERLNTCLGAALKTSDHRDAERGDLCAKYLLVCETGALIYCLSVTIVRTYVTVLSVIEFSYIFMTVSSSFSYKSSNF